ncbi:MAG: M20/M25/M40 family metallo-hydrolase [Stappiaceae bacterium]
MNPDDLQSHLAQAQEKDADIALLREAIGHESVTGNEAGFANFLARTMAEMNLQTGSDEFLPGRPNVWGARQGREDAPHLMFVGHTDTVHVRGWAENWMDDARQDPFAAPEIDGEIWGRGACDLKGGICAALAAFRLLNTAGIALDGSVTFAFIGDEESGEPGTGVSAGAKKLVEDVNAGDIAKPDFAVYVEPTKLDVYTAQIGFFIAEISITGKSAYFGTPEKGVDALKIGHNVLSAIWRHEEVLLRGPSHDLVGPSGILVTEIKGGGYIAVPGDCTLSVIRKLRPEESLDTAVAQFEAAIGDVANPTGAGIDIKYTAGRDHPCGGSPVEIDPDHPAANLLADCVKTASAAGGEIGGAPYWSESPFLVNALGCPAVYCAPGDISVAHTFEERINIQEYLAAVRAFALFLVRFCGRQADIHSTGGSK